MNRKNALRRPWSLSAPFAVLILGAGLLAAGCGSSSSGDAAPAPTPAGKTIELAPGTKASGTAVRIGYISAEGGSTISQEEVRHGAEAAIDYANDYVGGIAGRPVSLDVCKELEEPVSARTCANKMVEDKVAAVLVGTTGQGDAMVPIITGAGIPYTTLAGASGAEFTGKNAFTWSGGFPSILGSMARYAKDNKISSVAIFTIDSPAAIGSAKAIGGAVFGAAGVRLDVVAIPQGTPDATPQVTAALGKKPAALAIVGEATHCTSVLKAFETLGTTAPRWVIQPCAARTVTDAVPGALEGARLFTVADIDSTDKEAQLYRTVMQKYAPDVDPGGYAVTGYQGALGLVRALSGLTGEVTSTTIAAKIAAAKNVALPAGHGATFSCDGNAIPSLKAICSVSSLVTPLKGIEGTTYTVVDPSSLFH